MSSILTRPLFRGVRKPIEEVADQQLDEALQRLSEATDANAEMCEKVRRRQSSGRLKLVSLPPAE
jgi:hypothetical protein